MGFLVKQIIITFCFSPTKILLEAGFYEFLDCGVRQVGVDRGVCPIAAETVPDQPHRVVHVHVVVVADKRSPALPLTGVLPAPTRAYLDMENTSTGLYRSCAALASF